MATTGFTQGRTAAIRQRGVGQAAGGPAALLWFVLPAALALTGCIPASQPGVPGSGSSSSAVSSPPATEAPVTNAPLETTQASNKTPVYWIGRSNNQAFLYREFRNVTDQDNPVTQALRVMMSQEPLDPDFFTPWQNPKKLATSISGKNVITVDLSADAFNSNVDAATAERAVQQLVYTAAAAGASSGLIDSGQQIQVVVLVDGHTGYLAFNHVRLGSPMSRRAGMVAPVWIVDPQEGVSVAPGTVKINGRSTAPGGELRWEILQVDGSNAKTRHLEGRATAEAARSGGFTLLVDLVPGSYEVRVSQIEAGTPARNLHADTRGFTVK